MEGFKSSENITTKQEGKQVYFDASHVSRVLQNYL